MNKAKRVSVDRRLGTNCRKTPEQQQREDRVKELLIDARQKSNANKVIRHLAERLRCPIFKLLRAVEMQVKKGNLSAYVLDVLMERVEQQRKRHELSLEEILDLEGFKASRKEKELERQ